MHENEQQQQQQQDDLSDDSDYAAAASQCQTGDGSRMPRSDSEKSASSDYGGGGSAEVVYSKDNVAIHPTQYASESIVGRLRVTKQGPSLFLSWIPCKPNADGADFFGQNSHSAALEKDRILYTIKGVLITDVHSIRRHTPTIGYQYMIVVLKSGLAFAPFYFYTGGVREFLATLRQHVFIVRSADDANVFLVNNFEDPLQRSLSSLELPRIVATANKASPHDTVSSVSSLTISEGQNEYGGSSGISNYRGRPKHKSHDPAHDISIQVLEKFSLVTKFARQATSQLFRESNNDGFIANEKKHQDSHNVLNSINKPDDMTSETITNVGLVVSDPLDFEKLPLVWGRQRKPPLSYDEWSGFLDSEGRIMDPKSLRERIFYGGIEPHLRKEIWKLLLGYHEYDSTNAEREYLVSAKKSEYEVIKSQWQSISASQAKRFSKFRERKGLIDKDVVRTDRSIAYYEGDDNPNVMALRDILLTYSFYNFDLGYCQGMSDLLSPILHVMEDEAESFWCFVALMERLGPNFNRDQSGMHSQLLALSKLVELLDSPLHNYFMQADCLNYFFCFRWILIQFKREFGYDEVMTLWEVLWTHYLSEHFHLYICVAILKFYRSKIMGEQMDFDTLLKFINELSGNIDLNRIIREAESLCAYAGENGAACIPPGTPPSLPIETDAELYPLEDDVL